MDQLQFFSKLARQFFDHISEKWPERFGFAQFKVFSFVVYFQFYRWKCKFTKCGIGQSRTHIGCENVEQTDSRLPLQEARFERCERNNQTWRLEHFTGPLLRISPPKSPNRIATIPSIRIPEQPLHIQSNAIWNQTLTNILCNSNGTNNVTNKNENRDQKISYVDDILLLHQNNEYLKNMTKKVIDTLQYFGFAMNMEKCVTEPNQIVIFLGWDWNLANATVKTNPMKRLLLLHDLYNMRRQIRTGTEITVKQKVKLIGKVNFIRLQFQEASLFLIIMDRQKVQFA
ncbi:MAG: hypothetical protein EZS28_000494 [Streblomastix strix]|uniref:Reverse transcriptase domain-containing protein n=1 Tax=Streblomastix strix TaxID=222440 RepID=A0A5J4X9Z1_9EUKA|nr:MAG: hypothetical protein EZS28_000494 [Streblomastix strix]